MSFRFGVKDSVHDKRAGGGGVLKVHQACVYCVELACGRMEFG